MDVDFRSLNKNGLEFLALGEYARARAFYLEIISDLKASLLPEELGKAWHHYGLASQGLQDHAEAQKAYDSALACYRRAVIPPMSELMTTFAAMARLALAREENDLAWAYLTEELDMRKEVLANFPEQVDHAATAWCLHHLAEVFSRNGVFHAARQNLEQALHLRERVLPRKHLIIAENRKLLGDVCYVLNERTAARKFYRQALPILRRRLGKGHSMVVDVRRQLALLRPGLFFWLLHPKTANMKATTKWV